jgi:integrase
MVLRAIPVVRETATIPPRPAARASQAGVDVRLVQEFLGHASITSTAIYTAISPKRLAGVRVR